jgi:hypothetical protein
MQTFGKMPKSQVNSMITTTSLTVTPSGSMIKPNDELVTKNPSEESSDEND